MKTVTRALVVRSVDYKDSDKILTLLTPDMGKLSAGARGCRKKGSAIAAASPSRAVRGKLPHPLGKSKKCNFF